MNVLAAVTNPAQGEGVGTQPHQLRRVTSHNMDYTLRESMRQVTAAYREWEESMAAFDSTILKCALALLTPRQLTLYRFFTRMGLREWTAIRCARFIVTS